jgi:hypothetical protein
VEGIDLTRFLYRVLIVLHPPRFRKRFGDELMCVFDEAGRERMASFFVDAILSLLRQWLLRSNLWKMAAGTAISTLLLFAWGNSTVHGIDLSLLRISSAREMEAQKQHRKPHDILSFVFNTPTGSYADKQ